MARGKKSKAGYKDKDKSNMPDWKREQLEREEQYTREKSAKMFVQLSVCFPSTLINPHQHGTPKPQRLRELQTVSSKVRNVPEAACGACGPPENCEFLDIQVALGITNNFEVEAAIDEPVHEAFSGDPDPDLQVRLGPSSIYRILPSTI